MHTLSTFDPFEAFEPFEFGDGLGSIGLSSRGVVLTANSVQVTFSSCVDITAVTGIQVNIDGAGWEVVAAVASGANTVWVFTTTSTIAETDTVQWQYLGAVDSIVDCIGAIDVGALGPISVSNPIDVTAPSLVSAEVGTVANNIFVLVFDEDLAATNFATGWSIEADAAPLTITEVVESSPGTLRITTTETVYDVQDVTVSYNSVTGNITDATGYPTANDLASIVDAVVTNNSTLVAELVAPTLESVEVGTINDSTFVLVFSEDITSADFSTGWSIEADAVGLTITGATESSAGTLQLTVAEDVYVDQVVTISYDAGAGDITDVSGYPALNALASITDAAVINNSTTESPSTGPIWERDFTALALGANATYTRASTAYHTNADGTLVSIANNLPRYAGATWNGSAWSGTAIGLLREPAETNSLLYSNDLSNAAWTRTATLASALTAIDPTGAANSASTLTASANNVVARQPLTAVSASKRSSLYVKRRTGTGTVTLSQGGTTGSNLVTNGTFDTDTTGWNATNATLSVDTQRLKVDGSAGGYASQLISVTVGKVYRVRIEGADGTVAAGARVGTAAGGSQYGTIASVASGWNIAFAATSANCYISCRTNTAGTAFYDNITLYEVVETTLTLTNDWTQVIIPAATVTDPIFLLKLATSGDAIDVWGCKVSDAIAGDATSPIVTTTAAVTRAVDGLAYTGVTADNETRVDMVPDPDVDIDDWTGTLPTPTARLVEAAVKVYSPGDRP